MKNTNYDSFIGQTFGYLTITGFGGLRKRQDGRNRVVANWKCKCGKIGMGTFTDIKIGHTKSCGCYREVRTKEANKTHGFSYHPLFHVYEGIKDRCYNPKSKHYKNYGGRGIKICDLWLSNKEVFFKWAIDNGWIKGLELDREDNNGDYSPFNCRFISKTLNQRNKRNNRIINYKGQKKTLSEWCIDFGLKYTIILKRILRGWSIELAFETPYNKRLPNADRLKCGLLPISPPIKKRKKKVLQPSPNISAINNI